MEHRLLHARQRPASAHRRPLNRLGREVRLREWQCLWPGLWTNEQLNDYCNDMTLSLSIGMAPVVQTASPLGAINVMLAVMAKIAMENRDWIPWILDDMAKLASALDGVPPVSERRVH
jgi:hypothetical protein